MIATIRGQRRSLSHQTSALSIIEELRITEGIEELRITEGSARLLTYLNSLRVPDLLEYHVKMLQSIMHVAVNEQEKDTTLERLLFYLHEKGQVSLG